MIEGFLSWVACRNRAEYVLVMMLISFVALMVFRSIHFDYDVRFEIYDLVRKDKSGQQQPMVGSKQSKKNK